MEKLNKDMIWDLEGDKDDSPIIVTYDDQDRVIFLDFDTLRKKSITK
jgi:hypothetical protein